MSLSQPDEMNTKFYDDNAKPWSDDHLNAGYWQAQLNTFHKLLPKGKIIEIGCGGGRDARDLIKLGYEYVGTDISEGLLEEARKNVPGYTFLKQSMYDLFSAKKFDGFWASAVFLHAPKDKIGEALGSTKSVLKRGAIGYISVKKGEGEGVFGGRFFSFWDKSEFDDVLKKNGFEILDFIHDPRSPTDDWLCFFVRLK